MLVSSRFDTPIFSSTISKNYNITDDIILIEDRFFIKDLTKIFDRQNKITLDELKEIVKI